MGFLNYVYMQNYGVLNTPILEDAHEEDTENAYHAEEENQHKAIQDLVAFYESWGY